MASNSSLSWSCAVWPAVDRLTSLFDDDDDTFDDLSWPPNKSTCWCKDFQSSEYMAIIHWRPRYHHLRDIQIKRQAERPEMCVQCVPMFYGVCCEVSSVLKLCSPDARHGCTTLNQRRWNIDPATRYTKTESPVIVLGYVSSLSKLMEFLTWF